jgi:hypothetical protein
MFGAAEFGRLLRWCATATLLVAAVTLRAQEAKPPEILPAQLVREAVANEVAAANDSAAKHFFRSQKKTPKGSQTKLYVETNDAVAGMLVAVNDEPLNAQQQQEEINHLNWLAGSPEQLRKKRAREKDDADQSLVLAAIARRAGTRRHAGIPADRSHGETNCHHRRHVVP